jgi:hypothetical protein
MWRANMWLVIPKILASSRFFGRRVGVPTLAAKSNINRIAKKQSDPFTKYTPPNEYNQIKFQFTTIKMLLDEDPATVSSHHTLYAS